MKAKKKLKMMPKMEMLKKVTLKKEKVDQEDLFYKMDG